MANEVINLDTVFSGFNSGTDLQPQNTRTNNQGVKINDIAGFVKFKTTETIGAGAGTKGDMLFDQDFLWICTTSYSASPAVSARWVSVELVT